MDSTQNRFQYHPPKSEEVKSKHEQVRFLCLQLANELQKLVPPGREAALVITKLEETMMWANAGIARNQ